MRLKEKIAKEEIKRLWKFFLIGFIVAFLFFNWPDILVFSNYKVIWHEIKSVFNLSEAKPLTNQANLPETQSLETMTLATPGPANEKIPEAKPLEFKGNRIEVAKLGVSAPIIFTEVSDYTEAKQALKNGVLLYTGGAMPGENGKAIILGHSAPIGWPDIDYDNIFSNLSQLQPGDKIAVYFNQEKYTYEVFESKIFFPNNEDNALTIEKENESSYLLLITCWPRGKDYQRLAIFSRFIDKN